MESIGSDFPYEYHARRWHARWIGPQHEGELHTRALFRHTFDLPAGDSWKVLLAAEREYALFVNGAYVCRGSAPSPYYYKFYDEIDLSDHLGAGRNCIAVLVVRDDSPQSGLLAELIDADGNVVLATDGEWCATVATGWTVEDASSGVRNDRFHEYFDARLHPWGWERPEFDHAQWPAVQLYPPMHAVGCPWTRVVAREAPPRAEWEVRPTAVTCTEEGLDLMTRHRCESLSVLLSAAGRPVEHSTVENADALCSSDPDAAAGSTMLQCSTKHHYDPTFDGVYAPSVVLEFDRVITGYLRVEVGGVAGAHLDVGYVERLVDGHFNNAIEVQYADRYVLADGAQTLTSTNWKGFRYVKLRLTGTEEPVHIRSLCCIVSTAAFEERGAFASTNGKLDAVFDICRYTIRLCSRDYVMDTPWRERNQWLGDTSLVILPGIYSCFGDTATARQFLKQAAATQLPGGLLTQLSQLHNPMGGFARKLISEIIADYSLLWIGAVREYYEVTGDTDLVRRLYPNVVGILQFHWRYMDERGIVGHIPAHQFVDHVYKPGTDPNPAYNAIWYGALGAALRLAELLGDAGTAAAVAQTRSALSSSFASGFYDTTTGVYRDGDARESDAAKKAARAPFGGVSEQANMAAIAWGLASENQAASIVDHLFESADVPYRESAPYFAAVSLKAFSACDRRDLALRYVTERWGRRMVDRGMTSVTEEWTASGSWRGRNRRHMGQAGHEPPFMPVGAWHGPASRYVGMYRSLSHAWSAAPAEFLIRDMAGFRILTPGCSRIELNPFAADFDYQVTVPTPRGDVRVAWHDGTLTVDAPDGVEVVRPQ